MISTGEVARRPRLRIPALIATIWIVSGVGMIVSGVAFDLWAEGTIWIGWSTEITVWFVFGLTLGWGPALVGTILVELSRRWST